MRRGTSATEGVWQNRGSAPKSKDETGSRQLIEQRFGVLQDGRVEAFGEPVVDRREEITGFGALPLVAPEAGKAHRSPQLPEFRTLPTRNGDGLAKTCFSRHRIANSDEKIPSKAMHFGLLIAHLRGLD